MNTQGSFKRPVAGVVLAAGLLITSGISSISGQPFGDGGQRPEPPAPPTTDEVLTRLEGEWVGRKVAHSEGGPRRSVRVTKVVTRVGEDLIIEARVTRPGLRTRTGEMTIFADGTYVTKGISVGEVREIGSGAWSVVRNRILFEGTATVEGDSYSVKRQWLVGPERMRGSALFTDEEDNKTRSVIRLRKNTQPSA